MIEKKRIGLFDGTFSDPKYGWSKSAGYGGTESDMRESSPLYLEWQRMKYEGPVTVFTDVCLDMALSAPPGRKAAWLLEPRSFSTTHYDFIDQHPFLFSYILTHDMEFMLKHNNALWVPCGGIWVDPQVTYHSKKDKLVSMMTTQKDVTVGHRLRHEIQDYFAVPADRPQDEIVDFYGRGSLPISTKIWALKEYKYSIVVESGKIPGYFSEKLIDSIAFDCVPIYWGAPDIGRYIDPKCLHTFDTIDELARIVYHRLSDGDYQEKSTLIRKNAAYWMQYICPEDYMYKHYPWVFQ